MKHGNGYVSLTESDVEFLKIKEKYSESNKQETKVISSAYLASEIERIYTNKQNLQR
tara:strand:- start:9 stop:179 length:171 start_codon:yes stop_codon:yes gene_type:complete